MPDVGLVVQQVHMSGISRVQEVVGWGAVGFPLAVLLIAIALLLIALTLLA